MEYRHFLYLLMLFTVVLVINWRAELPKNVKCQCLMDCEAAQLLQGIQDQMVLLSADPTIKIPT